MPFQSTYIPYSLTGAFSTLVTDYLSNVEGLQNFYEHPVNLNGIKEAIQNRRNRPADRHLLHQTLSKQYKNIPHAGLVQTNIDELLDENAFTICTAHQPNIFTGHLYFIYKILHAIKLADTLKEMIPGCKFIPVYYMGSEDADLEELGEVTVNGKHYRWHTQQTGAVGRMKVDSALVQLIDEIAGQLSVEKYGKEILDALKLFYSLNKTIEQATFEFVNSLFSEYGLLILLPDNPSLKQAFYEINKKELTEQFSHNMVATTLSEFPGKYKIQAAGRTVNLFYLHDGIRARIELVGDAFRINGMHELKSKNQLLEELKLYPERFSQNVILRPLFQEMILPNVAFIGGGGELAYWLELKKVFAAAEIPYPVLVLRNSFMLINKKISSKMDALNLCDADLFKSIHELIEDYVRKNSESSVDLKSEKALYIELYQKINSAATKIDSSLQKHVKALENQGLHRIEKVEKKMLRSEKKKFEAAQRQLNKIKAILFPENALQERVENFLPFYAVWGKDFLRTIYDASGGLEQEFCIIKESE